MSIGLILGGIAKGYQQGEDLKDQRVKRAAAQQKLDADTADFQRLQDQRAGQEAIGQVGVTQVPVNLDWDPTRDVNDAIEAHHVNSVPQDKPGLIGILANKLRPHDAALGAGLVPINDPMQNPLGLADGTAVGPRAMPVGAHQDAPVGQGAATGTLGPNGVVVTAPRQTAPLTEEQQAMQYAALMRKTGDAKQMMDAGKQYFELHNDNTLKAVQSASPQQLELLIGDATKQRINIDPAVDAKGKPTGGFTVTDKDGNEVGKARDVADLRAQVRTMVDRNPGEAMAALHTSQGDHRAAILADATIKTETMRANAALKEAAAAATGAAASYGRMSTEARVANSELERTQLWHDTITQLADDPDMAIRDPQKYSSLAAQMDFAAGKNNESSARQTNADGSSVSYPVNRVTDAGQRKIQAFQSDPYVSAGMIGMARTKDGTTVFTVKDPRTGQPVAAFSGSAEAQAFARRTYPAPAAKKAH